MAQNQNLNGDNTDEMEIDLLEVLGEVWKHIGAVIITALLCAIIALALNTSAFFAVILNTSIRAIPKAQWEAGMALGHTRAQTFIRVVTPQAVRLLIPQAILLYIGQLQCSSFIALISIRELTRTGETIAMRTYQPFLVWGIVFALYFIISFPISKFARGLEKKVAYKY